MKFAYSTNAYMRHSIHDAIARVAKIGYAGVELMADLPHAWPESTSDFDIATIRKSIADAGLIVSNINAFMMNAVEDFWHPSWIEPDETYRRKRIDHTRNALTMARKIGAKCITTEPGGPLPDGKSREWAIETFIEGLHEVLPHAEKEGVDLLVEPEPDLLIENAEQFLTLADQIESPAFGLNFDIGHFYCVSDPLPETIQQLKHLTRHYHFEDIAATRVHEHLIPGDGAIDFTAVLYAIRETGYEGWLTVELYPYLDDPDGAGARALNHLKNLAHAP